MATGYRITIRQGFNGHEELLNSSSSSVARLVAATVTQDVASYPSMSLSILPTHHQYASFNLYTTFIKVTRPDEGKLIFDGRVITPADSMDSSGQVEKQVIVEDITGFLHDSVPPFHEFHNTTVRDFLQWLINEHNKQVEDYKQISLGEVTMTNSTDNVYRFTDETKDTYDNIQDKLIDRIGGEIRLRELNGRLLLDYVPSIGGVAKQKIELQHNLLSLTRQTDPSQVVSVLKPLGATQEPEDGDSTSAAYPRLNISSVNNGSVYLIDDELVSRYGKLVKTVVWDDVTTAAALKSKGQAELNKQVNLKTQIQLGYVDLSHITPSQFESFNLGDLVHIINPIQGIDLTERITGMTLDLLNVASSSLTIGEDAMNLRSYEKMQQKQRRAETDALQKQIEAQQKVVIGYDQKIKKIGDNLKDELDNSNKSVEEVFKDLQKQIDELKNNNGGDDPTPPPSTWKPGTMFMDIADYQRGFTQATYNDLFAKGVKGLIIKLTQGSEAGTAYINSYFNEQKSRATTAGMKFIGTYHYLVSTSVADAQDEARWYLKQLQANNVPKSTIVACDLEDPVLTANKATLTAELAAFHKVLSDAGYTNTADYSSTSWMTTRFDSKGKYKWIASWGLANPPVGADAWQFNSTFNGMSLDVDRSYNKAFI